MKLVLTLKKKWFDMILSGEKKEEYREIKPYWATRLEKPEWNLGNERFKEYDVIEFRNGYSKNARRMTVQCTFIGFGWSKPKWSDGREYCYVIKLGEILSTLNVRKENGQDWKRITSPNMTIARTHLLHQ